MLIVCASPCYGTRRMHGSILNRFMHSRRATVVVHYPVVIIRSMGRRRKTFNLNCRLSRSWITYAAFMLWLVTRDTSFPNGRHFVLLQPTIKWIFFRKKSQPFIIHQHLAQSAPPPRRKSFVRLPISLLEYWFVLASESQTSAHCGSIVTAAVRNAVNARNTLFTHRNCNFVVVFRAL